MYHRVVPPAQAGDSLPSLVVPPDRFAAQMAALAAAGWHTITASELSTDVADGRRPPARTFVITFDDGYDDGFTYALPILQAHGFRATFYVITGRIGDSPGPLQSLTPEHVQALAAAGMEIGDHTVSHADLPALTETLMRYQIVAAAARIEQLVGSPPTTLAYPYGARDAAVIREVAAAGFGLALTNVEGCLESWSTRFVVPRLRVGPGTTPQMLLATMRPYATG